MVMADEDAPKTAFQTRQGKFEFGVMSMGLINAGSTFQRTMDKLLAKTARRCSMVYLDDVIIFSPNLEQHLKDCEEVLLLLLDAGFT